MPTEADEHGRLYLSKDIRERYGETFHIVEYSDHIELVPVDDGLLDGLWTAVGDAFEDASIDNLRKEAQDRAPRGARG